MVRGGLRALLAYLVKNQKKRTEEASMTRPESVNVEEAKKVLNGQQRAEPQEIVALAKKLREERAFRYARQVSARAREEEGVAPSLRLGLVRQEVLATYKDPDLPVDDRYDPALELLEKAGFDRAENQEEMLGLIGAEMYQEMLGIAGAVHKYKWEAYVQKQHLERSYACYRRGYEVGVASDRGYTGINAAFVLDQLASLEEASIPEYARMRREEAKRIREDIVATLPPLEQRLDDQDPEKKWWFHVTVAEAYFGLERYEDSLRWLKKAKKSQGGEVVDWWYETTARQLASLARLQGAISDSAAEFEDSPPGKVLLEFLGNNAAAVFTSFVGKVGLALSGGGFRAALFHIGVLARLAELDVLRSVEVLSCVSGGSIVGAHYYLEVRKLLQENRDGDITKEDYIAIVQRVAKDFLDGVQQNIRMQVAAEPRSNLRMIFEEDYSRIQRVGELFEEKIFASVEDGNGSAERWLGDLSVKPEGEPPKFQPKHDNWRRSAKVPILILNATTLNTGHSWQFTASYMGESPTSVDPEIDANYRLRRKYYSKDAPPNKVRLGHAVAASACVPGLFDPYVLDVRYQKKNERVVVHLVDGGVHDNQGVVGLLEQECNVLLVSDATGQMEAESNPGEGLLSVLPRSNNVLMARVRAAQYRDIVARRRSSLLRGLMFVHLKKYLEGEPADWAGCKERHETLPKEESSPPSYKVPRKVQERLANIRTDLDSFADMEAYALMTSGYRMTESEFGDSIKGFSEPPEDRPTWHFLAVEEEMHRADDSSNFMRLLNVASNQAFKFWRLSGRLRAITVLSGIVLAIGSILACLKWWSNPVLTVGKIVSVVVAAAAILTVPALVMRAVGYRKTLRQIGVGIGMGTLGWIAAQAQLRLFDKRYLELGSLREGEDRSE